MTDPLDLGLLVPRADPGGRPWSDHWYWYCRDPEVGMLKVAWLRSLDEVDESPRAYVHVAFDPADGGPSRQYDHHAEHHRCGPTEGPVGSYLFEVADVARFSASSVLVTLPEVTAEIELTGPLLPYFDGDTPGASPFLGDLTPSASDQGHWMITTLATPSRYRFRDEHTDVAGQGTTYAERGWGIAQAPAFAYAVAVSDDVHVVTAGGGLDGHEMWAGRVQFGDHDLVVVPVREGHTGSAALDPVAGTARIELTDGAHDIVIEASADPGRFYDHTTPSRTVFDAAHPVMKTMDASLRVTVRDPDGNTATASVEQAILEFGGANHRDAQRL